MSFDDDDEDNGHSVSCCCNECERWCQCAEPIRDKHSSETCKICGLTLWDDDPIYEECEQCKKIVESINDEGKCEECSEEYLKVMKDIKQITMRNRND
jgi:hypothetical protein